MNNIVAMYRQNIARYPKRKPYNPPSIFPEYPFRNNCTDNSNDIYFSLRNLFKLLGLDKESFGSKIWNPLGVFISPGQTVLLKPNLVKHFSEGGDIKALITHGSLIRAVADYVYVALKGKGRIIIADGPMDDADFGKIIDITGLYEIKKFYRENSDIDIEVYDLRQEFVVKKKESIADRIRLKGDPSGYTCIDLNSSSEFNKDGLDFTSFMGSECKQDVMSLHHNKERHEYLISNTLLNSDVVINLPKMKTHKRSGVTLGLKNMIGITGDRNWLPHFNRPVCDSRKDTGKVSIFRLIKILGGAIKPVRDTLRQYIGVTESTRYSGSWYGNDIIWRTIIDLANIVSYADKKGIMRRQRQRKIFTVVDGIIGGEGDGPLNPRSKSSGVLVAGLNSFCVDIVTSRIMGFDPMKIPKFKKISRDLSHRFCEFDIMQIRCVSNIREWNKIFSEIRGKCLNFRPHYGWKNHIEVQENGKE